MSHVEVKRTALVVHITLSEEEAQELGGILGNGCGLVGGLFDKLNRATDYYSFTDSDAYQRGKRAGKGFGR